MNVPNTGYAWAVQKLNLNEKDAAHLLTWGQIQGLPLHDPGDDWLKAYNNIDTMNEIGTHLRTLIHQYTPEIEPFLRNIYRRRWIVGLRNVEIRVLKTGQKHSYKRCLKRGCYHNNGAVETPKTAGGGSKR